MKREAQQIVNKWLCQALDKNDGKAVREACLVLKAFDDSDWDDIDDNTLNFNFDLNIENPNWKFEKEERHGGVRYEFSFDNGYGASVIKNPGSYGVEDDLWELAVLKDGHINYDTPITGDVEGYLTDEKVNELLRKIEQLPAKD